MRKGKEMTKKTTDIVAYITLIGWIVAYFAGTKEESKFHLNQALVIWLFNIIMSVVSGVLSGIPVIGLIISIVVLVASIALFVFWLMGLIYACQGQEKEVPILGAIKILK